MSKEKFGVGLSHENGESIGIQKLEVKNELTTEQKEKLLATLKARFEKNNEKTNFKKSRRGIEWTRVQERLEANPEKLWSINEMERTGGQPDVIKYQGGKYIFVDCAPEAPKERELCYDAKARENAEKDAKRLGGKMPPEGNAVDFAKKMGIEILDLDDYKELIGLGNNEIDNHSVVVLTDDNSNIYGSRRERKIVMVGRPWRSEEQRRTRLSYDDRQNEFYYLIRDNVDAYNTSDVNPLSFRGRLEV